MNNSRKFFLLIALSLISQSIMAAWSLEPSYFLRYERNDNIYLTAPGNELAVTGGTFSPRLAVIMEEETQKLSMDTDISLTRYRDHDELNRDEGSIGLNWRGQATEFSTIGINGSYATKSSLDQSLDVSGLSDQQVDIVNTKINPSWKYQISELWSVIMELSYSDIMYDQPLLDGYNNAEVIRFTDRTSKSASLTLEYYFTEQDTLSMYASGSKDNQVVSDDKLLARFLLCNNLPDCFSNYGYFVNSISVASDVDVETRSRTWQLGYEHQFSEISSIGIRAGKYNSHEITNELAHLFDTDTGDELDVGSWSTTPRDQVISVYNFNYKYKGYASKLSFDLSRNRIAASTGGLDDVESAKIIFRRDLTERFFWSININAERRLPDKNAVTSRVVNDSTRTIVLPSLFYRLDRDWSISLGYRYAKLDMENSELPSEADAVFFTMNWRDPKLLSTN